MKGYTAFMRPLGTFLLAAVLPAAQVPAVYKISTVAGSSSIGDGGPATAAQIGNIQGVAMDRLGNIFLSDTDRNLVRKIDAKGLITTIAGVGVAGFSGDGGPAASAALNLPYGLAADLSGNVYIADLGNQRVRRVAPDGSISTVAGTGVKGSLGDGGSASSAQLMSPRNVATDAAGNLYISEFEGHRVRRVASDGKISTVAGTGVAGFRGDGGLAINAQIGYPAGLTVDRSGAIYLADSQNQRIRKIIPGGIVSTIVGGTQTITLQTPVSVAVDSAANIYIADASNVLHQATPAGAWNAIAGTGNTGFSGDGAIASKAQLSALRDLALDSSGDLFLADGIRIREINARGSISTVAGDGFLHALGDGAPATKAILNGPTSLALDRFGNLYIADTGTQRIRMVGSAGIISTFAGTGVAGYNSDGIPAGSATLYSPMGTAADISGNIYIADTYNHRLREVMLSGSISTFAGTGTGGQGLDGLLPAQTQLRGPRGACIGLHGTIYIADTSNHRIVSMVPGGFASTFAGNGTAGLGGDGGPAYTAELNQPNACATDSAGNLYIADTFNHRIAKIDTTGVITTVAGTGQPGTGADGTAANAAALNSPRGVAVDDNGDIFIADTGNNLIRQITPDGLIHTIAGQAQAGFTGDGGLALSALLNTPGGIVMDGAGALYFADTGNNRVRRLVPQAPAQSTATPGTQVSQLAVVNAASLLGGAISPGEIVTIYGSGLGPIQAVTGSFNPSGILSTQAGGTELRFDGVPAPIFYAQTGQINAQAPYTIAGQTTTHLEVFYQGQTAGAADLPVAATSPGGFPTVLNPDGSLNSATNPAMQGAILTFFATGEGLTTGPNITGQAASAPYALPGLPVSLSIGGASASLLYAGEAPGLIGMLQVNAAVPAGLKTGSVNAVLSVGFSQAPPVAIWLQ
jgi:uncharacterized protein (TIGR03437 family)